MKTELEIFNPPDRAELVCALLSGLPIRFARIPSESHRWGGTFLACIDSMKAIDQRTRLAPSSRARRPTDPMGAQPRLGFEFTGLVTFNMEQDDPKPGQEFTGVYKLVSGTLKMAITFEVESELAAVG